MEAAELSRNINRLQFMFQEQQAKDRTPELKLAAQTSKRLTVEAVGMWETPAAKKSSSQRLDPLSFAPSLALRRSIPNGTPLPTFNTGSAL
jgi:hypothetical protein